MNSQDLDLPAPAPIMIFLLATESFSLSSISLRLVGRGMAMMVDEDRPVCYIFPLIVCLRYCDFFLLAVTSPAESMYAKDHVT